LVIANKADAKLLKLQGRLKKCSLCIGVVSGLSVFSALVMIAIYPSFPIDEYLPRPPPPEDQPDFPRFGDQQW